MSPVRASGAASALNGSPWIIVSAARDCARSSVTLMVSSSGGTAVRPGSLTSVVGILERRNAVVVEGADAFDPVRVHRRAPVRLHHDRDGLFDRLALAEANGALDRLHCGG